MTNSELKDALLSGVAVVWKSGRHGTGKYKRIREIIYSLNEHRGIVASAVLDDYDGKTTVRVLGREVFAEEE